MTGWDETIVGTPREMFKAAIVNVMAWQIVNQEPWYPTRVNNSHRSIWLHFGDDHM